MKRVVYVLMKNKTSLSPKFSLHEVYCCLQLLTSNVPPNHNGKGSNKVKSLAMFLQPVTDAL